VVHGEAVRSMERKGRSKRRKERGFFVIASGEGKRKGKKGGERRPASHSKFGDKRKKERILRRGSFPFIERRTEGGGKGFSMGERGRGSKGGRPLTFLPYLLPNVKRKRKGDGIVNR